MIDEKYERKYEERLEQSEIIRCLEEQMELTPEWNKGRVAKTERRKGGKIAWILKNLFLS